MRTTTGLTALLFCALLGACAHPIGLRTPAGFVELAPTEAFTYRATSAEGVVLAVRELPNEPRGDLAFWASALEARLGRSYAAVEIAELRTASGHPGRQLRSTAQVNGRPHRYWVTVFVTAERVFVVEAGGDQAYFDENEELVQATVRSFEPS